MISVKCPACGLVDWNVGDCKRCGTPLAGQSAEAGEFGYYVRPAEAHPYDTSPYDTPPQYARAGSGRAARAVLTLAAVGVLALAAVGALYLAHKPSKKQWFWSFYRHEPTVAEIFAHNVEVSGGAERLAELRSFRAEGRLAFSGGETGRMAAKAGGQVAFVMHAKEPDKVEAEIRIGPPERDGAPANAREKGLADYYALFGGGAPTVRVRVRHGFDGRKGWEYIERTVLTPGSTVPIKQYSSRALEGAELEKVRHYSQTTGFVRLAGAYTSLKLTGREPVTWENEGGLTYTGRELLDTSLRGHEAYVVSGVNRQGRAETFYFDTLTGLLLRLDLEAEDAEGEVVKVVCELGDFKEVGGLKLPHRLRFRRGEELMTMTFNKYFPNDPIPDSTFEPPEPTE